MVTYFCIVDVCVAELAVAVDIRQVLENLEVNERSHEGVAVLLELCESVLYCATVIEIYVELDGGVTHLSELVVGLSHALACSISASDP